MSTTTVQNPEEPAGPLSARSVYAGAVETFDAVMQQVGEDAWSARTPCADWDVRALVNHVVGEDRWVGPLLAGRTIDEVGDTLSGDLLGDDPQAAWSAARDEARAAVDATPDDQLVGLSTGPTPLSEYLWQLGADHLIHAWDLATAIGVDLTFDDALTEGVAGWFTGWEDLYRQYDAIAARAPLSPTATAQDRLLAAFGRRNVRDAAAVVVAFGAAFNARDLDAIMAWTTEDCAFESTAPPDGRRYEGQAAVREAWQQLFADSAEATFTEEAAFAYEDRVVVQWRYDWQGEAPGHVRGVDLFRIRDGLVAEKLSYVKG